MTSKLQLLLIEKWQDEEWRAAQQEAIRKGIAARREKIPQWGRPRKTPQSGAKP